MALSLERRTPRPGVTRHRCSVEPGLSSPETSPRRGRPALWHGGYRRSRASFRVSAAETSECPHLGGKRTLAQPTDLAQHRLSPQLSRAPLQYRFPPEIDGALRPGGARPFGCNFGIYVLLNRACCGIQCIFHSKAHQRRSCVPGNSRRSGSHRTDEGQQWLTSDNIISGECFRNRRRRQGHPARPPGSLTRISQSCTWPAAAQR